MTTGGLAELCEIVNDPEDVEFLDVVIAETEVSPLKVRVVEKVVKTLVVDARAVEG